MKGFFVSREISTNISNIVMYPDGRMDTKNASSYLGLSEKTLAMMRCQGTGPRFVKRGRIFYYKKDLDEWLETARYTSTAQAQQAVGRARDSDSEKQIPRCR